MYLDLETATAHLAPRDAANVDPALDPCGSVLRLLRPLFFDFLDLGFEDFKGVSAMNSVLASFSVFDCLEELLAGFFGFLKGEETCEIGNVEILIFGEQAKSDGGFFSPPSAALVGRVGCNFDSDRVIDADSSFHTPIITEMWSTD